MVTYEKTKPEWGFRIEMWMMHELGLRGLKRDVYAVVYSYTFEGGWKQLEMNFLAEFVGATDRRVRQVIRELEDEGLLKYMSVTSKYGERVQLQAVVPEGLKKFQGLIN